MYNNCEIKTKEVRDVPETPISFHFRVVKYEGPPTEVIKKALILVDEAKKAHPNAEIHVEVEV